MIRNYQRSGGTSNVDLSPIYYSLQTINSLLYNLDIQTTASQAINSLSNSINLLSGAYNWLSSDVIELNGAYNSLSSDVNEIEQKLSTMTFDNMHFITDTLLTTYITNYNTDYNTNVEIFEPFVQSITNYNYISAKYPNQRFNLPIAILNDTNANQAQLTRYTLEAIDGGFYILSDCKVNTLTNFNGLLAVCDINEIYADTISMAGGNIIMLSCNTGLISLATISIFSGQNCDVKTCFIDAVSATNCKFDQCTILNTPWRSNSFRSMTINENRLISCGLTDCVVMNEKLTGYYSECNFYNVSFPNLNITNFSKCSGTVYIPKVVNNSVLFDINGYYLYNESDYVTIYTEPSTYTSRIYDTSSYTEYTEYSSTLTTNYYVTTDYTRSLSDTVISRVTTTIIIYDHADLPQYVTSTTTDLTVTLSTTQTLTSIATTIYTFNEGGISTTLTGQWQTTKTYPQYYFSTLTLYDPYTTTRTLTSTLSRTSTLTPQLLVKCLPEYDYQLPPTQLIIGNNCDRKYIDLKFIRNSTDIINMYGCTGNIDLVVETVKTLAISNNKFYNANIDIIELTASTFQGNEITNCTINSYNNDAYTRDIANNYIYNFVINNYAYQNGMAFSYNDFFKAKFLVFTDDITFLHIENSYHSVTFEGFNDLINCTITNMINDGTCNMSGCYITACTLNDIASISGCTIERLVICPGVSQYYDIEGNEIGTLILPESMTDFELHNGFITSTITY